MKKPFIYLIYCILCSVIVNAQSNRPLKFNATGEFKIVQFTDTHIDLIEHENLKAYEVIKEVIEIEKPDLAVLTGDIVSQDNPHEAFLRLAGIFATAKVPWAIVFGNHESEHNLSRKRLSDFLPQLAFCLNSTSDTTIGFSTFALPVYDSSNNPGAVVYCLDSNINSTMQSVVGGYGWFTASQINWYRKESSLFTTKNNKKPLSAVAFFHIPLPEYTKVANQGQGTFFGGKREVVCCPEINTGMFAAMLEGGDVMGTFVGHDHTNDYIGLYYNIALAYGRVSKQMKDPADPLPGGRVIVLKQGKHEFDSWIREYGKKKVQESSYPASFK
ncbi:MAG: metallophosphoesterase family protein [Mariniphaga sp.]